MTREPLGVIGAVTPWNFPLDLAVWKVAPALAAGNSVVLKPAEQAPLSSLRLAELAAEAGVPEGVLNVVPGLGHTAGEALGRHPDVDVIAFTGSGETGKRFLRYAADSNAKQVWLECGGKARMCYSPMQTWTPRWTWRSFGAFYNQGAVCSSNSRLLLHTSIAGNSSRNWPSAPPRWLPATRWIPPRRRARSSTKPTPNGCSASSTGPARRADPGRWRPRDR